MTARNERPIYRLCEAARKGDARTVTRMVGRDPSLGRKGGPSGRTALWTAARWGHQGIVEFLLDAGGDIDGRCIESCRWAVPETPLIAAIRCGHPDVAEFLLARGARSDVYTACYTGDVAQVRRAVAEDAEIVNAADSDDPVMSLGMLHWALYGGQAFVVELLLASGADPDHSCGCQRIHEYGLPLSFALYFDRRLDLVEMLLEHGAAPTKGMLADAIGDGDRELLDLWARFGHRHPGGMHLHRDARHGQAEMIGRKLAYGADIEAVDNRGRTALHIASSAGKAPAVVALLDAGADVEARDGAGDTPLVHAVRKKTLKAVPLLLQAGADSNAVTGKRRDSLLHLAVGKRDAKLVALLIAHGGDPLVANGSGVTPAMLGHDQATAEVVRALETAPAEVPR